MPKILNAKTVHDYNAYVGHADQHPLVSVIDYAALPPIRHSRTRFSVYALFLRDDCLEDLTYGCSKYDYREGTLICVSPGQIGGVEDNGEVFRIEGWALLFSPELLHGTPLAARMKEFTFFAYQVNEALHMTAEERATLIALMKQIQEELCRHPDVHQRTILVAYIELILNFCLRFYERQFATRKSSNHDVLPRDGYLCEYDDLTQLPVDILEDIIIRIYQDGLHCTWKSGTGKIRKKDVIRTKSAIYGECFAEKSADILLFGV